jgi:hypothetical protein
MHFTTDNNKDGIPDSKGYEPLPLVSFGSMDDELNNVSYKKLKNLKTSR